MKEEMSGDANAIVGQVSDAQLAVIRWFKNSGDELIHVK